MTSIIMLITMMMIYIEDDVYDFSGGRGNYNDNDDDSGDNVDDYIRDCNKVVVIIMMTMMMMTTIMIMIMTTT